MTYPRRIHILVFSSSRWSALSYRIGNLYLCPFFLGFCTKVVLCNFFSVKLFLVFNLCNSWFFLRWYVLQILDYWFVEIAMDIDGDFEDTSRRIQVRFITKLKAPFKVPANAIAIPSNLTRLGLSTVVNNLLSAGILSDLVYDVFWLFDIWLEPCFWASYKLTFSLIKNYYWIGNPEWEEEPFDFLIDGELVRMSLEKFLLAKGISAVI